MKMKRSKIKYLPKGGVLIIAMIFLAIFSSLGIAMVKMSSDNVKVAHNHYQGNRAMESAQSGLEIVRYAMEGIPVSGVMGTYGNIGEVYGQMGVSLAAKGMTNIGISFDTENTEINIASVDLDDTLDRSFTCNISELADESAITVDITGYCGDVSRTIKADFYYAAKGNTVFDFGVATKGPLHMTGQAEIDSTTTDPNFLLIDAGVYIEGDNATGDAFSIGNNSSVAGDVTIANEYATYDIGTKSVVGGADGSDPDDPITDHINKGAEYVEFPSPNPAYFKDKVVWETVVDANSVLDQSIYNNIYILADAGPITFASDTTINGILYIEAVNDIHFAGQSTINGIIVGEGSLDDVTSTLKFSGQVESYDVSVLEGDSRFDNILEDTGTFIVAPGFEVDMSGQSNTDNNTINGAIACSGVKFSGQAGGTFNGSIVNYADDPMELGGQTSLIFNRSGAEKNPAGFGPQLVLSYMPDSYRER